MDADQRSFTATVRHCLFNPAAVGYLTVVAAVLVWVGADLLFVEHQDASFAGVWAFVVTAPTSWLFLFLPGPLVGIGVVVGALVQAAVLGAAYRRLSARTHHRTGTSGA
ncbi:SCO4225 family membrane protein [Streptomyces sp. NPDC054834]